MEKKKVYIVGGDTNYMKFLAGNLFERTLDPAQSDVMLFTGGEDVTPAYYKHKKSRTTRNNETRDGYEKHMYNEYVEKGKKFGLGICRGSQFLTVMSGGTLWQDVTGHAGVTHPLEIDGEYLRLIDEDIELAMKAEVTITSTHHQMMNPYLLPKDSYDLIGYAYPNRSLYYVMEDDKYDDFPQDYADFKEPEIVYYKNSNCLCVQGHPEQMGNDTEIVKFLNKCLTKLINK